MRFALPNFHLFFTRFSLQGCSQLLRGGHMNTGSYRNFTFLMKKEKRKPQKFIPKFTETAECVYHALTSLRTVIWVDSSSLIFCSGHDVHIGRYYFNSFWQVIYKSTSVKSEMQLGIKINTSINRFCFFYNWLETVQSCVCP